jgi:hypothetical protein
MQRYFGRFYHFFVAIPERFKSTKIKAVLQEHIATVGTTQMSPLKTKCIINIIENLCDSLRLEGAEISQQERGSIFIPDRNCVMRSVNDVCYDEKDFAGTCQQWGSKTQNVPPLGISGPRVMKDGTSVR